MNEGSIDQDVLNTEIRKFLKKVGITSQQEIERAIAEAVEAGRLAGLDRVRAQVKLEVPALGIDHLIEQDLLLR
jgi:hypothetical protein